MKTLLSTALAALLFCAPAFADQAPETPLVTGPNMQQTPASQILIKVRGSTIQTLGAALAASGCTTNCTLFNPTITGGSIAGASVAATTLSATGAAAFTGTGTGLSVTNNMTVGGNLIMSGDIVVAPLASNPAYFFGNNSSNLFLQLGSTSALFRVQSSGQADLVDIGGAAPYNITTNIPIHLDGSGTWSSIATNAGFYQNTSLAGSSTTPAFYNELQVIDNVADSSVQGSAILLASLEVGSSSSSGAKNTIVSNFGMAAASGNTTGVGGSYSAGQFTSSVGVNDNGTSGATRGLLYGVNVVAHLASGATYWNSLIADEHDVNADPGSSVAIKLGMQIVQQTANSVQGSTDDAAISLNNGFTQTAGVGWKYGILFGRNGGEFPMAPTGTMIGAVTQSGTMLAANGIDWHLVTFSGNSWNDGHVTISGAGLIAAPSLVITGTATFALETGAAATYACFTSAGLLMSSSTAC